MQVIRHDDVGEDKESARLPGLVKGLAGDRFNRGSSKYGKPILRYGCDEKAGSISGDLEFLWVHFDDRGAQPQHHRSCSGKSETFRTSGGGAADIVSVKPNLDPWDPSLRSRFTARFSEEEIEQETDTSVETLGKLGDTEVDDLLSGRKGAVIAGTLLLLNKEYFADTAAYLDINITWSLQCSCVLGIVFG